LPFCRNCGKEIAADAKFCSNCGALTSPQPSPPPSPAPIQQPYTPPQIGFQLPPIPPAYKGIIILGYIFAIAGGLIGMLIGGYLSRKPDSAAIAHGKIIFAFSAFMMAIWVIIANIL